MIHLVKAEDGDFPTNINAGRADAEDALLFKPSLGIDGASGDGCRQRWWHYDGHNVQHANHTLKHSRLEMKHKPQDYCKNWNQTARQEVLRHGVVID